MHQYGVHRTIIAHSINRTVRSASCSIVWNLWAVGSLSRLGAFVAGSVGSIDAHLFGLQRVDLGRGAHARARESLGKAD